MRDRTVTPEMTRLAEEIRDLPDLHREDWDEAVVDAALANKGQDLAGLVLAGGGRVLVDVDHPAVDAGVEALLGHHPERGGQERRQAVFVVLTAALSVLDREGVTVDG